METDFDGAFQALRRTLRPYADGMDVKTDTPTSYYLNMRYIMRNKQPLAFAAVVVGKRYVSFHLLPVYGCPDLVEGLSPTLKKRMQGKACFNFRNPDEIPVEELTALVAEGHRRFLALMANPPAWM